MLKEKTAVITGGSRGIGKAIALKLASDRANIAIICRNMQEEAETVCEQCRRTYGVRAKAYSCDISDEEQVNCTVSEIIKEFGSVYLLVNNAGITEDGLLLTMSEQCFAKVVDINLKGAFLMIKHCLKNMLRKKEGSIINISSVSGLLGNPGQCNYAAAKAGLIGLTKSVAREYAQRNIRCNAIAPGFINTDMTSDLDKSEIEKRIPLGRFGRPEEIAEGVAFLAKAAYVTGEVLKIDGGFAM